MEINLKDYAIQQLTNLPDKDLEGFLQLTVSKEGTISCGIMGAALPVKAMLCMALERQEVRSLFEECYAAVLARRAGIDPTPGNTN